MGDTRAPSPLPERPNLDQLRKQAKELHTSGRHASLSDAQLALARQYGFPSWPKLKRTVELLQLRQAIDDANVERVRALIAETPALAKAHFADGMSPLHVAVERNVPDVVEALVTLGVPIVARYGTSAHSALSWALTVEAAESARRLVALGTEPDLFCAAGLGDLDRVKAFWSNGRPRPGASTTGASRTTESGDALPRPPHDAMDQASDALCFASRLGQFEVARWLVDQGANVNWRGYMGATCLAWAEYSGNRALCELLRQHGASEDLTDYEFAAVPHAFPVMVFADWGFAPRLARVLTADPTLAHTRTRIGTPLHLAAAHGMARCVGVLLEFGADRSATDDQGRTPAERAASAGYTEVAVALTQPP